MFDTFQSNHHLKWNLPIKQSFNWNLPIKQPKQTNSITRWWFHIFFYFHLYLGKIPILTNIFQLGWNHQRETSSIISMQPFQVSSGPWGLAYPTWSESFEVDSAIRFEWMHHPWNHWGGKCDKAIPFWNYHIYISTWWYYTYHIPNSSI